MSSIDIAIDNLKKNNPSDIDKRIARGLITQANTGRPIVLYPEHMNDFANQMRSISKRNKRKNDRELSENMKNLLDTCTRLYKSGIMSHEVYIKIKNRLQEVR